MFMTLLSKGQKSHQKFNPWQSSGVKPFLTKKMNAYLKFAQKHVDDPQEFRNHLIWTDDKIRTFIQHGPHNFHQKFATAYTLEHPFLYG